MNFLKANPPAPFGYRRVPYQHGNVQVPKAPALRGLKTRNAGPCDYDRVEVRCPYCGEIHTHGWDEGIRLAHCTKGSYRGTHYFVCIPDEIPTRYTR